MKKTAVISGTFDPITIGHMDLIQKASELFDTVYVVICDNAGKTCMFDAHKRHEAVKASVAPFDNVKTDILGEKTIADYTKEKNGVIVRGIRNGTDADYEISLAHINKEIAGVETIILAASCEHAFISSTFVRELYKHNKPHDKYLPSGALSVLG